MLGDVELRQHLDPADHTGGVLSRDSLHLLKDSVDAETHDQRVAVRHEVDVARAVVRGLEDDRVHELDRRGIGDAVRSFQIDDVVRVLLHAGHELAQQAGAGLRLLTAGQPMELGVDVGGGGNAEVDRVGADDAQLVGELNVGRIDDRNLQPAVFDPVRKGSDPRQDVQRDRLGGVRLDALDAKVDQRQPVALGQRAARVGAAVDIPLLSTLCAPM